MSQDDRGTAAGGLVVPAASVFVLRGDRLLALKRSARKDAAPGAWEVVSGRVDPGEQPYDTAVRECREETGLAITPEPTPIAAWSAERAGRPMLVVGFRARSDSGDVVLSDEHDDHAWMTIEEFARACAFPLLVETARRAMKGGARTGGEAAAAGASVAGHVILWEFRVRTGGETAFEAAYGPDGDWARLFRRAPGYLGTELLRVAEPGTGEPARYLTVDRWVSRAAFEAFRDQHRREYDELDRRCEDLTLDESPLGTWTPRPEP